MLKVAQNLKFIPRLLSDEGLAKKASLNALSEVLDYGARLVVGFIIAPLLVAGLGDFLYGAWQVMGRLIGYISVASGRATQVIKWSIASRQSSTDYLEKQKYVGSAIAVSVLFLPLLLSIGGVLVWFTPIWLDSPPEFFLDIRITTGLLVANTIVFSITGIPLSVLQGENLGYKRMGLSAILVFVGGGLTALALHLGGGITSVAVVRLVNTLLVGLLFLQITRTQVPWFGIAKPGSKLIRSFFRLSGWFLSWRLILKLIMASDVILLGFLISAEFVTIYTLSKYVPETITSVVAIMVGGITPGLGGVIGSGDLQKAARIRGEIMSLTWLVATAGGVTIILWNQSFVQLWVGQEYYTGAIPNLLITLMVMQLVLIRNDAFIIDLTLDLRIKVQMGAVAAVLSLLLAGILVSYFDMGFIGLCMGFIAGRSILSVIYPWQIGRVLNISPYAQLRSAARPTLVTVAFFLAVLKVSQYAELESWIGLFFITVISMIGALIMAFYTGLSADQREQVLYRFKQLLKPILQINAR